MPLATQNQNGIEPRVLLRWWLSVVHIIIASDTKETEPEPKRRQRFKKAGKSIKKSKHIHPSHVAIDNNIGERDR